MRRLGNTLYVTSQGAYLSKEGECVKVARDGGPPGLIPIHGVDGVVAFGLVGLSPPLLGFCAERGVTVSWFTEELRLPAALLIILVVLLVRPQGIFGKPEVKRV